MSQQVTLLNSNGSSVLLGNVLMIPVADAILYVQPVYVESSRNPFPVLQRVITVYGNQPAHDRAATLSSALVAALRRSRFQTSPATGTGTGTLSAQAEALLAQAQTEYEQAQVGSEVGQPRGLPERCQRPRVAARPGPDPDRGAGGLDDHHDDHQPDERQRLSGSG